MRKLLSILFILFSFLASAQNTDVIKNQTQVKPNLTTSIYSKSYWTAGTDFTTTSLTLSYNSDGTIRIPVGNADFLRYFTINGARNNDENVDFEVQFKLTAIGGTTYGTPIGRKSSNSFYSASLSVDLDFSQITGTGTYVKVGDGIGTTGADSVYTAYIAPLPTVGDQISLTYSQRGNTLVVFYRNLTTGFFAQTPPIVSNLQAVGVGSNWLMPNTGDFCIWNNNAGPTDIMSIKITSYSNPYPKILWLGDSKTQGSASNYIGGRTANLLKDLGSMTVMAGVGDRLTDLLSDSTYLKNFHPKYVVICAGRNDIAASVSAATYEASYDALVAFCKRQGWQVIHMLPIPETVITQTTLTSYITSTYSGEPIINSATGWVNATHLSADNVHPNPAGYRLLANNVRGTGYIANANDQFESPAPLSSAMDITPVTSSSAVAGLTSNALVYSPTASTLGSTTNAAWDNTNKVLQLNSASKLDFASSGSGNTQRMWNFNTTAGYATTALYPSSGTNVGLGLDLIPKGTGQTGFMSGLNLFNTDYIAGSVNYEYLGFLATGTAYSISTVGGGSGNARPLSIYTGANTDQFNLGTAGTNGMGIATSSTSQLTLKGATTGLSSLRFTAGVQPTSGVDGDMYNSSSTHHLYSYLNGSWYQLDQQGGGGLSGLTSTQVLYATGATTAAGSANHVWDNTNSRLGLGLNAASPAFDLHIQSNRTGATVAKIGNTTSCTTCQVYLDLTSSVTTAQIGTQSALMTTYENLGANKTYWYTNNAAGIAMDVDAAGPISMATNGIERVVIGSGGAVKLSTYGSGSNTGTATKNLQVDASGNIIEGAVSSSTSGTYTPTLTNTTNLSAASLTNASYIQVGNIVDVTIGGTFNITAATASVLTVTLPVTAVTTTQATVGSGGTIYSGGTSTVGYVSVNSGTTATYNFTASSAVSGSFIIHFKYKTN